MSNNEYLKKLKDPRWQRKRLEIFERDNFTCRNCLRKDATLHVHHKYYDGYKDPWDYPDDALVMLCEHCHGDEKFMFSLLKYKEHLENKINNFIYSPVLSRKLDCLIWILEN